MGCKFLKIYLVLHVGEETALVGGAYSVVCCVKALCKHILLSGEILKVHPKLVGSAATIVAERDFEIEAEIVFVLLRESQIIVANFGFKQLRSGQINRCVAAATGIGNFGIEAQGCILAHFKFLPAQGIHHIVAIENGVAFNVVAAFVFRFKQGSGEQKVIATVEEFLQGYF